MNTESTEHTEGVPSAESSDSADPNRTETSDQLREGAKQVAEGATRLASGAKDAFQTHVAPTLKSAASDARERVRESSKDAGGPQALAMRYAPVVIPIAALVALLGLHLPIYSFDELSINYMDVPDSDGPVLQVLLIIVIIVGGINAWMRVASRALPLAAAGASALVGIIGMIDGLGNLSAIGASLGSFVLGAASLVMLVAAILTFLHARASRKAHTTSETTHE